MLWIILVVLLILAIGGAPVIYPHGYGWGPSGIVGVLVIVVLVLLLLGRL